MGDFVGDLGQLACNARAELGAGLPSSLNGEDKVRVVRVLNEVLATELLCVLRFRRHYYTAEGLNSPVLVETFLEHAGEVLGHADMVAERIIQLDGEPDFTPPTLVGHSDSSYAATSDLEHLLDEDVTAACGIVQLLEVVIAWLAPSDPTTAQMLERIVASEKDRTVTLLSMLQSIIAEDRARHPSSVGSARGSEAAEADELASVRRAYADAGIVRPTPTRVPSTAQATSTT